MKGFLIPKATYFAMIKPRLVADNNQYKVKLSGKEDTVTFLIKYNNELYMDIDDWQNFKADYPGMEVGSGIGIMGDFANNSLKLRYIPKDQVPLEQAKLLAEEAAVALALALAEADASVAIPQVMNGRTYRCVLGYRLGIPMFLTSRLCPACSRTLDVDAFGDHAVSCVGVVGLKHWHNLVRDTLLDICSRSRIFTREVDIGLVDREDRPLRAADVLLYSWDGGNDVCVDLTGSSPLTQSGLSDFVPGQVVADAARRKRAKYLDLCTSKGYGFLPFSFSSLGELDADVVALLRRIQKFTTSQDVGARAAPFIFPRIIFAIARGVGAQLVPRLPTNFL